MATLLMANGERVRVRPNAGTKWTLEELQAHVGGYIEVIRRHGTVMVVDEEGKRRGLTQNLAASVEAGCVVVGSALILEPDEKL